MFLTTEARNRERAEHLISRCREFLQRRRELDMGIGKALLEFKQRGLYRLYDFASFDSWLGSGVLDIPITEARNLVLFMERAASVGVSAESAEAIGVTSRKAILQLPASTPKTEVRAILDRAIRKEPVRVIREAVQRTRTNTTCETFGPFRVYEVQQARVIREALRRVAGEKGVKSEGDKLARVAQVYLDVTKGA